ncbi:MAG: hypothetical protein H6546_02695 [Chitinophagales bacterium]|nr:hypothetical protein [Chitinophagales bacterium]
MNLLGDSVEMLFAARCMERGYMVSKPLSDKIRYDLILDCNGVLKRIQIKSASTTARGRFTFKLQSSTGGGYSEDDCDLMVLHPRETEYFVFLLPELFIGRARFNLDPSKHQELINNFDILCIPSLELK